MIRRRAIAIPGSFAVLALALTAGAALAQTPTCQQECFDDFNTEAGQCESSCANIQDPAQRRSCVQQCIQTANQQYQSCISVASCNGPESFPCASTRCPAVGRHSDGTCEYQCDYEDSPNPNICVENCMASCTESYQACVNDAFYTFPCKFDDLGACLGCDECCGALEFCDGLYSYYPCLGRCRGLCGLE